MKNPLHYIQQYPHRTKQLLGLTYDQFEDLLAQAEMHHERIQFEIERNKIRINQKGGGRKPKLEINVEVCLCLFYLRQMPTFEVLGLHFGISKTEANDTFHYWLSIFRDILPACLLEQVEKHDSDYAIALELLKEFKLIVDSMEQPRERPSDNQEQKEYFSGKKKQHTFKNQFITLPSGKDIVDVEVGKKGPTSDISLFREQQEKFEADKPFGQGRRQEAEGRRLGDRLYRQLNAFCPALPKTGPSPRIYPEQEIKSVTRRIARGTGRPYLNPLSLGRGSFCLLT